MSEVQPKRPENPWNIFVGSVLRAWRRSRRPRLTQEHLATVLGLQRTQISLIETGRRTLTLQESLLLRQAYGLSLETLLTPSGQPERDLLPILQELSPADQQEIYTLFYRALLLLASQRRQQGAAQREEEQGEEG